MDHILTDEEYDRMTDNLDKVMHRCKCGHRVVIPKRTDKMLCSWCGYYVFRNKKDEFKCRMKEKIK